MSTITEIIAILDESGSMDTLTKDTIGGYNSFITKQKVLDDVCYLTTYHFAYEVGVKHFHVPIKEASLLTGDDYRPEGGTALLDAIGTAITEVTSRISSLPPEEKPDNVLFLIITDGEENSSKKFKKPDIQQLIKDKQDIDKWNFVYIGANVDEFAESQTLGLRGVKGAVGPMGMAYKATSAGVEKMYAGLDTMSTVYRSSGILNTSYLAEETKE
jgi:hypothetical protein